MRRVLRELFRVLLGTAVTAPILAAGFAIIYYDLAMYVVFAIGGGVLLATLHRLSC